MTIINNVDTQRFTFNGIEYYKNFMPVVVGNKIRVLNAYDSSIELTSSPTLFSDFEVDSNTYLNVADLQSDLLPILYTRATLSGGGSGSTWGSITGTLSDQTDLQTALDSKLDKVSTAGVERAYIINADGSQGTKATSEFKDVLEFANLASFPVTGETGKIYLALDTNKTYRWDGSAYVQIGGTSKKYQTLLFQVPTNGTALNNTQSNFCQSRFNGQSVLGSLGLVFGAGITETSGVISLTDFSDKATPEITPNYISQVKHIKFSYSRNVAESGANTNIVIRVMAESRYQVDMQLIAEYNLVSSTALGTHENKVDIPVLTHLNLSAYSNIKWCVRTNNATAQTFNFIRLNIDIEEV